jgi:diguanylate cyclase (GGDEF)-like protein
MTVERLRRSQRISRSPGAIGPVEPVAPPGGTGEAPTTGHVFGIPESEFTPKVRRALGALLGEARTLHDALGRARVRLEEVERDAYRDPLLPLPNRRAFVRELTRQIALAARYRMPATLIYLDLDGLKGINDTYGHPCGDAVLSHFAELLLAHVRESDVAGRLGGDEFGIVLAHADQGQAETMGARLDELLRSAPARWNGMPIAFTFSFGTVELAPGLTGESAVAQADAAMYRRKHLKQ